MRILTTAAEMPTIAPNAAVEMPIPPSKLKVGCIRVQCTADWPGWFLFSEVLLYASLTARRVAYTTLPVRMTPRTKHTTPITQKRLARLRSWVLSGAAPSLRRLAWGVCRHLYRLIRLNISHETDINRRLWAEGPRSPSPGQRPGGEDAHVSAAQRPNRSPRNVGPLGRTGPRPRALPWAGRTAPSGLRSCMQPKGNENIVTQRRLKFKRRTDAAAKRGTPPGSTCPG